MKYLPEPNLPAGCMLRRIGNAITRNEKLVSRAILRKQIAEKLLNMRVVFFTFTLGIIFNTRQNKIFSYDQK